MSGAFFLPIGNAKMKYSKPFLSYEEQASLLECRGLIVQDRQFLLEKLSNIGYYRLSAYWYPFKKSDSDDFKENTNFDNIYRRYRFDRRFRILIFDALERVETAVKALIVRNFAENYGPFGYIDQNNFNNFTQFDFNKFLQTINDAVEKAKRNQERFVVHFFAKYDEESNLPLQMLSELITFGTMFTMLKHLHHPLQLSIAKEFGVSYSVLEQWLFTLNYVRNVCAHNVRLWNRRLSLCPTIPSPKKHPEWNGVQNNYPFVILLVLRTLLHHCAPNTAWKNRMEELFDEYSDLPINCMGFPENWKDHILWK